MYPSNFFLEFLGKIGAPVFAASLVSCLLSMEYTLIHVGLLMTSAALMFLQHHLEHRRWEHQGSPGSTA